MILRCLLRVPLLAAIILTVSVLIASGQSPSSPRPATSPTPKPSTQPDTSRSRRASPDSPNAPPQTPVTGVAETRKTSAPDTKSAPAGENKPAQAETKPAPPAETTVPAAETKPESAQEKKRADSDTKKDPVATSSPADIDKSAPASEEKSAASAEAMALRDEIDAARDEQERARLRLKLADYLATNGSKPEAIAELRLMGTEDRFDPQNFYNIANALARLGDTEGAIQNYMKAIDQRKGRYSRAFHNLGVMFMRQGRWYEAYDALMNALRLENFRYAEASYNLGRLYAARGETDLAVIEWQRALVVNPEHTATAQALSRISKTASIKVDPKANRGRPAESGPTSLSVTSPTITSPNTTAAPRPSPSAPPVLTVDPDTFALLKKARIARERSRPEEAVKSYRKVIKRMGGYFPPANIELAYSLITLHRNDEAVEVLLPVSLKDGERFPGSYYHLGRLYEAKSEFKLAEENYSRAAGAYGDTNAQLLLDLSRMRERVGNLTGALASLEYYITVLERQGLNAPDWCGEKLADLKQKLATSPGQPKP